MPVYSTNYKCLVISIASAVVGILGNPKHVYSCPFIHTTLWN